MGVLKLKAYFDDSGGQELPAIAVAGYVGGDRVWGTFEPAWQAVLHKHNIPYFHFKEIRKPGSPLHKLCGKDGAEALKALLIDLAAVISKCQSLPDPCIHQVGALVPARALARFNQERGRNVDAISFALFNCKQMMQFRYPEYTIEALLDQIAKAESKIARAKQYLATFPDSKGQCRVSMTRAKGDLNIKTVHGLQAADFAAYEMYRANERMEPFFDTIDMSMNRSPAEWAYDHEEWLKKNNLPWPHRRQSLMALGNASAADVVVWTYESLCAHDDLRNGRWSSD
jgi:hypothetical protein